LDGAQASDGTPQRADGVAGALVAGLIGATAVGATAGPAARIAGAVVAACAAARLEIRGSPGPAQMVLGPGLAPELHRVRLGDLVQNDVGHEHGLSSLIGS